MNTVTVIDRVSNIERTITISSTEPIPTILKYIRENEVNNNKKENSNRTETEYRILSDDEHILEGDEYFNTLLKEWDKVNLMMGKKEGVSDEKVGVYKKKWGEQVQYRRKVNK